MTREKYGIREIIKKILSLITVLLYPCMFMYFQNIGEGNFLEIFEAVLVFTILATLIAVTSFSCLRNFSDSIFYSQVAMLVLMNFNTILEIVKKWLPGTRKAYLFLFVAFWGVVLLVILKKKHIDTKAFVTILGIVFGILIIFNFTISVPKLISKITHGNEAIVSENLTNIKFNKTPNVYYLVYDEYGGFENLERYYDYDNAEFEAFLKEEKFNMSYGSHNTESLWTSTILPNVFNLSYVASDEEYSVTNFTKIRNCVLFQLFSNNGYTINLINHNGQLETAGCNVLDTGKKSENLSDYILNNSIWNEVVELKKWVFKKITGNEEDYAHELKKTLNLVETCVEKVDENQPTLTVSYVCAPHHYFALDENGLGISTEFELDYLDKSVYLGQLKYITKSIETTIKNIKEKDPDALIIIQSDHGMRLPLWMETYYDVEPYDKETERPFMQNIVNCTYYQGKEIEIEGLSGINTLRKIFNEVLGTEYEMLEAVYMN